MTTTAIILILFSAILHATWNLLTKAAHPSQSFFFIFNLSGVIVLAPLLIINLHGIMMLPPNVWGLILLSGSFQAIYYTSLAKAYRNGDISLIYPLVRALPVLVIPVICFFISLGKPLSYGALSGMLLISLGCILMPVKFFSSWHIRDYKKKALWWILLGALGTCGYTVVDSNTIPLMAKSIFNVPASLVYGGLITVSTMLWLFVINIFSGVNLKKLYTRKQLIIPIIAGVICSISYILVLTSMKYVSNVSYVSGFRQLSIPLGILLGIIILKEKIFMPRIIGTIIITVGLIITAFF